VRLFVAIDLDGTARSAIIGLQKRLAGLFDKRRSDLRWTRPDQLHLTLAFIGEVAEDAAEPLFDSLTPPIAMPAYALVMAGLGAFPPRGAPRVLWLGASAGARETIAVQHELAGRLGAVGVQLEQRPFHPHLTLARWRESGASDRRTVVDNAATGEIARIVVDHVTLFRSRLSPQGSTYTACVQTPLNG
jgi:RNA 2',3'-cyclic 3'-phosphodiesterase